MSLLKDIIVPDIGDYNKVDVIEIHINEGDFLKKEDSLITLETDKATMEIPSPYSGRVQKIIIKEGEKVGQGDCIAQIELVEGSQSKKKISNDIPEIASEEILLVPNLDKYGKEFSIILNHSSIGTKFKDKDILLVLEKSYFSIQIILMFSGIIKSLNFKTGDKIFSGDIIGTAERLSKVSSNKIISIKVEDSFSNKQPFLLNTSPVVRRLARESNTDLTEVHATGPKKRITKKDVEDHIKLIEKKEPNKEDIDRIISKENQFNNDKFGLINIKSLSRIKKISGANLHLSWKTIPHITLFEDIDITDLEKFRQKKNSTKETNQVKLTLISFLIKSISNALKKFPIINSTLSSNENSLIYKNYINIGVAVDTKQGLLVPVIQNADKKSIYNIANNLIELIIKAKSGKIKAIDMQGGCFTISNLGSISTIHTFSPIINIPEVAILGISKAVIRPIYDSINNIFIPKLILPLSLSLDHRVVDGAESAKFLSYIGQGLSDLRELLL